MSTGKTPEATESEKRLGELGAEMKAVAANMTAGRDYMKTAASKDTSQRKEEQALGAMQAADAESIGKDVVTSYDQRDRVGVGLSARSESDLQAGQAALNVAGSDLGQSAVATQAESKLGYDAMAVNQARLEYNQAKSAAPFEIAGAAIGAGLTYGKGEGWFDKASTDPTKNKQVVVLGKND